MSPSSKKTLKNDMLLQLTIVCDSSLSDSLSDYLVGVMEAGVEIGVDDHIAEQTIHAFLISDGYSVEWQETIVSQLQAYCTELAAIFNTNCPSISAELLQQQDWSSNWKKYFIPFAITPSIIIKPTWESYQPKEGEQVIEMDPGMAFGTGHHGTTTLCMELLAEHLPLFEKPKVLDVGTGTGILAMGAALQGASEVLGIDNDPEAVAAAAYNISHNSLHQNVTISSTPLEELEESYSLVVANIIHDVLVVMVTALARVTLPGGGLILSGILHGKQADNIKGIYEQAGFFCTRQVVKGEWAALYLRRQ